MVLWVDDSRHESMICLNTVMSCRNGDTVSARSQNHAEDANAESTLFEDQYNQDQIVTSELNEQWTPNDGQRKTIYTEQIIKGNTSNIYY